LRSKWQHAKPCQPEKSNDNTTSLKTQKPGAAVTLGSSNLVEVRPGVVETLNILLNTQEIVGNMHVDINPGDGLRVITEPTTKDFLLGTHAAYPLSVSVLSEKPGRFYLNLNVVVNRGESTSARHLAVIIQSGPQLEVKATLLEKPQGIEDKKVISLPAQEEIISQ
jgi:hypothetical protein